MNSQPGSAQPVPGATQVGARTPDGGSAGVVDPARTRLGAAHSQPAGQREDGSRRFGPGVPPVPGWSAPRAASPSAPPRRGGGGLTPLLTALVVLGVLAYLLLWRPEPLTVAGAEVAPLTPPGAACDVTVDLVGTIHTNGLGGTLEYRWLRSDGEVTAPLTQTVHSGQTVVQVHLLWTLAGRGSYPATATLQILQPQPVSATGGFTYSCR